MPILMQQSLMRIDDPMFSPRRFPVVQRNNCLIHQCDVRGSDLRPVVPNDRGGWPTRVDGRAHDDGRLRLAPASPSAPSRCFFVCKIVNCIHFARSGSDHPCCALKDAERADNMAIQSMEKIR